MRPSVRIGRFRGVPSVTLAAHDLEATFLPSVGMLGASLRHRGEEFLALPGGIAGYRAGHQTGMPLLAPWANRLGSRTYDAAGVQVDLRGLALQTDDNGLSIHGTMTGQRSWEVRKLEATPAMASLRARFDYGIQPALLGAFPFPHEIELDIAIRDAELFMTTSIRPTGARPVPVSFGFHPYFRLPHGRRASWRLHLPRSRHLRLDERQLPTGRFDEMEAENELIGQRTFDDLYALDRDRKMAISGGGHGLTVAFGEGYSFAQVYAPPGGRFVCLEPMTAPTDALTRGEAPLASPGDVFTARFWIAIETSP